MSINLIDHWNATYDKNNITKLGWYEDSPEPSLQLINECNLSKNARILNVGVGASTLIDALIKDGYKNIIASDLSSSALQKLQDRLGKKREQVTWIVDDLTNAKLLPKIGKVDLWHDRAVLHFFIKKEEQEHYFNLLTNIVKPNGYVIIAAFNTEGAQKCSGLPVHRYNKEMLQEKLKNNFTLLKDFNYTYTMPNGDTRPYIYTLFKKNK